MPKRALCRRSVFCSLSLARARLSRSRPWPLRARLAAQIESPQKYVRCIVVDLSLLSAQKKTFFSLSNFPLSSLSLSSLSSLSLHALSPHLTRQKTLPLLVAPRPDVVRQRHQRRRGPRVERAQLRLRVRDQARRDLPRLFEAEQRRVGRLLRGEVLARGLAQHLGGLRDVEDVVDDLEGEADRAGVGAQRRDLRGRGAAEERTRDDRGLQQGGLCFIFFSRDFWGCFGVSAREGGRGREREGERERESARGD